MVKPSLSPKSESSRAFAWHSVDVCLARATSAIHPRLMPPPRIALAVHRRGAGEHRRLRPLLREPACHVLRLCPRSELRQCRLSTFLRSVCRIGCRRVCIALPRLGRQGNWPGWVISQHSQQAALDVGVCLAWSRLQEQGRICPKVGRPHSVRSFLQMMIWDGERIREFAKEARISNQPDRRLSCQGLGCVPARGGGAVGPTPHTSGASRPYSCT